MPLAQRARVHPANLSIVRCQASVLSSVEISQAPQRVTCWPIRRASAQNLNDELFGTCRFSQPKKHVREMNCRTIRPSILGHAHLVVLRRLQIVTNNLVTSAQQLARLEV